MGTDASTALTAVVSLAAETVPHGRGNHSSFALEAPQFGKNRSIDVIITNSGNGRHLRRNSGRVRSIGLALPFAFIQAEC